MWATADGVMKENIVSASSNYSRLIPVKPSRNQWQGRRPEDIALVNEYLAELEKQPGK